MKSQEAPSRTVPTIGFNLSLSHASTARKQREALEALLGTYFALLTRGGQTVHSAIEFDTPPGATNVSGEGYSMTPRRPSR